MVVADSTGKATIKLRESDIGILKLQVLPTPLTQTLILSRQISSSISHICIIWWSKRYSWVSYIWWWQWWRMSAGYYCIRNTAAENSLYMHSLQHECTSTQLPHWRVCNMWNHTKTNPPKTDSQIAHWHRHNKMHPNDKWQYILRTETTPPKEISAWDKLHAPQFDCKHKFNIITTISHK